MKYQQKKNAKYIAPMVKPEKTLAEIREKERIEEAADRGPGMYPKIGKDFGEDITAKVDFGNKPKEAVNKNPGPGQYAVPNIELTKPRAYEARIFTYEDKKNELNDEFKHPEAGDYETHKRFGETS